jgi:type III restriction enzyme
LVYWLVSKGAVKEGCLFFLKKADGWLYPDFLCRLPEGSILAIEYKGAESWTGAEDDQLIGSLWTQLSGGEVGFD